MLLTFRSPLLYLGAFSMFQSLVRNIQADWEII